jgi:hypothetical protein
MFFILLLPEPESSITANIISLIVVAMSKVQKLSIDEIVKNMKDKIVGKAATKPEKQTEEKRKAEAAH